MESSQSNLIINLRQSGQRGTAEGVPWLNSYHTFSFADYYDNRYNQFHSLRVINEDRVAPSQGFGTHPHANFEIFSYIVNGSLRHKDNMHTDEVCKRGDIQFTSAGSGVTHSEFNDSDQDLVHFIQIWVQPDTKNLKPNYQQQSFSDDEKLNKLKLILSKTGEEGSIQINQDVKIFASILEKGKQVSYPAAEGRDYYIHLIDDIDGFNKSFGRTAIKLNNNLLKSGDGAFVLTNNYQKSTGCIDEFLNFEGSSEEGADAAEFILFDLKRSN